MYHRQREERSRKEGGSAKNIKKCGGREDKCCGEGREEAEGIRKRMEGGRGEMQGEWVMKGGRKG